MWIIVEVISTKMTSSKHMHCFFLDRKFASCMFVIVILLLSMLFVGHLSKLVFPLLFFRLGHPAHDHVGCIQVLKYLEEKEYKWTETGLFHIEVELKVQNIADQ